MYIMAYRVRISGLGFKLCSRNRVLTGVGATEVAQELQAVPT